jgi:hypothetical protein
VASANLIASALASKLGIASAAATPSVASANLIASALASKLGIASAANVSAASANLIASAIAEVLGGARAPVVAASAATPTTGPLRSVPDADRFAEQLAATLGEGSRNDADVATLASALRRFVRPEAHPSDLSTQDVSAPAAPAGDKEKNKA